MGEDVQDVNRITISKVLGLSMVALGLILGVWIAGTLYNEFFQDNVFKGWYMLWIPVIMLLTGILASPGIILFYYGFRLMKEPSVATIRLAVGTLMVMGVIVSGSSISAIAPDLNEYIPIIIATLISIPFYIAVCVFVMKREGLYSSKGDILTKDFIKLLAYIVSITCFGLLYTLIPSEKDTVLYVTGDIWKMTLIFGSMLLGYIFHKVVIRYVKRIERGMDDPTSGGEGTVA